MTESTQRTLKMRILVAISVMVAVGALVIFVGIRFAKNDSKVTQSQVGYWKKATDRLDKPTEIINRNIYEREK